MSTTMLAELANTIKDMTPDAQERVKTYTAVTWMRGFIKQLAAGDGDQALTLVTKHNAFLSFALIQLTQPDYRPLVFAFYSALEKNSPTGPPK